ncbi:MAG: hypothetical protein MJZ34_16240 [Paludibacteraceae bacterium]|nr:hypothetical protein [Paludibacteraceae bacterium]
MEGCVFDWSVPIFTALIGSLIGTFGGAWLVSWFQDRELSDVRRIAIKALKLFEKYDKKPFSAATDDFNSTLNVSEKQMVLVALHKLGLPIDIVGEESFNIHSVKFLNEIVDKDSIKGMILHVRKKYCDRFFYSDVQSYFVANNRIYALRATGKRFVKDVLSKSASKDKVTYYPESWQKNFSDGELRSILVLKKHLNEESNFDVKGNPKEDVMNKMVRDIDRGLYDNYLVWDYEMYENMVLQTNVTKSVQQMTNNHQ